VTDPSGLSVSQTFTITVNAPTAVNRAPTVTSPGAKTVTAGQPLSFTITGSDPDAGNTLRFAATSTLPSGATLNATTGAFSWTPTAAQASATPYSVTVTATDNGSPPLTSAPVTFAITVRAVATPPPSQPTTSTLRIKEAEWEHSKLHVHGRVTPGRVRVTIINAATGTTIGTVWATSGGEFEGKLRVGPAPCKIQAKANGQSSAVVTVSGACRRSRSSSDD
jgi:Putative Ig domain